MLVGDSSYPAGLICVYMFFTAHVATVTSVFAYAASMLISVSSTASGITNAVSALCYCIGYFASDKLLDFEGLLGLTSVPCVVLCVGLVTWLAINKFDKKSKAVVTTEATSAGSEAGVKMSAI